MSNLFPCAACLQTEIRTGKIEVNLQRFRELLAAQKFSANTLVVLPEVWASGFDYPNAAALAEQTPTVLGELQQVAAERSLWFAGSLLEPQLGTKPCNTLFLVGPDGVAGSYRKQHMFRFWQEEDYLQAGQEPLPISTPFWRF